MAQFQLAIDEFQQRPDDFTTEDKQVLMDYSDFAPPIYIDRHFSRLVYSFIDFLFVYMTVKDIGIAASTVFLF